MKLKNINPIGHKRSSAHLEAARLAQRQGRWADAYKAYAMVLRNDAQRFGILVQMGHMSKEDGDYEAAEGHYMEAMTLKPHDWDLHVQLGHLYNRLGEVETAKTWYAKANAIQPTAEVNELLHTIGENRNAKKTSELRREALAYMDARRFKEALPNVKALYESHGLRDFDVILGHVYRELGHYSEAKTVYEAYFERCLNSHSRYLDDSLCQLINILEILENSQEIIVLFARLKNFYSENEIYSDFRSEQVELLQSHIRKIYGVLR